MATTCDLCNKIADPPLRICVKDDRTGVEDIVTIIDCCPHCASKINDLETAYTLSYLRTNL